ncbi:MAG TPA: hypothetical protein VMT38_00760 [Terracidiphilus sp.]|nr:hypothetical protein [Terracidiphilus sp.]
MMMNVRKLAALDLYFLGPYVIVTEFALGVAGPIALGVLTLRMASRHVWPLGLTLFGGYLLLLGVNYIPMLLHAIGLVRSRSASIEIADELSDRRVAFRKYRLQSLFLLVPFLVPLLAILQQREAQAITSSDER